MQQRGMTLLEVLVALAIFSYGALALVNVSSQHLRSQNYLEQRTFAQWVAANQLTQMRLSDKPVAKQKKQGESEMAGETYFWRMKTENTASSMLKSVTVEVRTRPDDELPLSSLQTFVETDAKPNG